MNQADNRNASNQVNSDINSDASHADTNRPDVLAAYPIIHRQNVSWGEMDVFCHLNNVVFFRYAESARIAYLLSLGAFDTSMVTVLASTSCQYLRPVTFPDTLLIGVRCQHLGNTSVVFDCCFYSNAQKAAVAKVEAVVVRLNADGKSKKAWTTEERQQVQRLEAQVGNEV